MNVIEVAHDQAGAGMMYTVPVLSTPAAASATPDIAPGSLAAWVMALRMRSLLIAISPVIVAAALVWQRTGHLDVRVALLILAASIALQIITNLQNDVGYTLRGGERSGTRIGLPRATALGLLTTRQVRIAIICAIGAAVLLGLPLVAARGVPVLLIGIASIVAALAYMGGPRPIAYTPFGELVVFVFFGLLAVGGADYTLTGAVLPPVTALAAVAMGALAAAALVVNNHRDIAHDEGVGRRTLPVVLGAGASRGLYAASVLLPFALVPAIAWLAAGPWLLLPLALLPLALRLVRDFVRCPPGLPFNGILFRTFKLELAYAALLSAGAIVTRWLAS
jgi:1,4-dihydroxy-2-naphthoate octaprenyltransferase